MLIRNLVVLQFGNLFQEENNQDEVEDIYNAIMRDKESDKVMFITGITTTGKKVYRAVDLADTED